MKIFIVKYQNSIQTYKNGALHHTYYHATHHMRITLSNYMAEAAHENDRRLQTESSHGRR